jgi:hypothetical protein
LVKFLKDAALYFIYKRDAVALYNDDENAEEEEEEEEEEKQEG